MNRALVAAGGLGLLIALAARSASAAGAGARAAVGTLDEIYQRHADEFGVDWRLVKATAQHESAENPAAVNAADKESIGLMQVLCQPDGAGGCRNRLPAVTGWSGATRARLLGADFNVYIGAQILAVNIESYGTPKGIAVYNAWDQHTAPAAGPFKNQSYVDDVLRRARALGWDE